MKIRVCSKIEKAEKWSKSSHKEESKLIQRERNLHKRQKKHEQK